MQQVEAVVIGAGAFGASIAFHLAKRGRRVALLERHDIASQTSPRAAGLTQQIRADSLMTHLAMRSVAKLERFYDETGEPLTFHQSGSIKLARTPKFAEQIHDEVARGKELGLDIELITPEQAEHLAPFLRAGAAEAAWNLASDLYLEPVDLPRAYVRAPRDLAPRFWPRRRSPL